MSAARDRTRLGSDNSLAARAGVYLAGPWLEIDRRDYTEVERRRIPFLEVELVTLHSRTGGVGGWIAAALALLFVVLAALVDSEPAARYALAACAFLFGLLAGYALVVPTWVVTVFGRRATARIVFRLRAGKARELYLDLGRRVREARDAYEPPRAAGPAADLPAAWPFPPPPPAPPAEPEPLP